MNQRLWRVMQADHDLVFELINALTGGPGRPQGSLDKHRKIALHLVSVSSVHEAAEELAIWPQVQRRCPNGESLIGEALAQEKQAKRALNELNHIKPGSTEFDECVDTVAAQARSHITYEQNQIWPRLADHLNDEDAERLADLYLTTRKKAPTRPHPHTPPTPALLGSVGIVMARLDRARDAITGRTVPGPASRQPRN